MQAHLAAKRLLASGTALTLVPVFYVALAPQPAYAQLQDIVVTARKREEALLDVPFAISAFTEEDLQIANLRDFTDLSQFTPGMVFQNATANRGDRGTPNIIMRGLNLASPSASGDPALLFIDGAPVFGGEVGSFIDVERVEVLRGPQTAYFGRNTFSGAVNLVTKDPGDELAGFVGLEYASFDTTDLQGNFEGAIVPEKLAFRVSARRTDKGGQYINNFNGEREIGAELSQSLVGTLVAKPTDWFKLKIRGSYMELEDGPSPTFRFDSTNANCDPDGNGTLNWFCGKLPDAGVARSQVGQQNAFDPAYFNNANYEQNVIQAFSLFSDSSPNQVDGEGVFIDQMGLAKRVYSGTFQASVDLPGGMSLDWISAYSKILSQIVSDENFLPRDGLRAQPPVGLSEIFLVERYDENSSHEMRITSDSEQRLRWVGGFSLINGEAVSSCVSGIVLFNPSGFTCRPVQEIDTLGVFGGAYYDLTDKVTLSAELRWQNDDISIPTGGLQNDFDNVGGRVTLEYRPNENLNYFLNYSRGFRPGGFNGIFAVLSPTEAASLQANSGASIDVDEETLDQVEIGVKGSLFDNRLSGSIVGYWGEITDQQVTQVATFTADNGVDQIITVLSNIGKIGIHGVELEGAFQATEALTLQGTFAWNYTEYLEGLWVTGDRIGAVAEPQDYIGNQVLWTPEFTASAVATYARPVFGLPGFARLEYIWESTKYGSEANLLETGPRSLVNARLGVDTERYRAEFYVTNLFDNDTYNNVSWNSDIDVAGANAFVAALPERRVFGARVFFNF